MRIAVALDQQDKSRQKQAKVWSRMKKRIAIIVVFVCLVLTACDSRTRQISKLMQIGIELLEDKEYDRAIKKFDEALKIKNTAKLGETEMDILKYRAEAEYRMGDFAAAAHTYSLLCDADVNASMYRNIRVICMAKSGQDLDLALQIFQEKGAPKNKHLYMEANLELVKALIREADRTQDAAKKDEALSMLMEMEKDHSMVDAGIANSVGMIYFHLNYVDKALQWFDLGLGYEPENDVLLYNKAICYEYLGEFGEALSMFTDYNAKFGESDEANHEIAFLQSRVE